MLGKNIKEGGVIRGRASRSLQRGIREGEGGREEE